MPGAGVAPAGAEEPGPAPGGAAGEAEEAPLVVGERQRTRWREVGLAVATSPYVWANLVYLCYTCEALAVDFCSVSLHPDELRLVPAPAPAPGSSPSPAPPRLVWRVVESVFCAERAADSPVYKQYIALASVHLVNAFQYMYLWRPWFAAHARHHTRLFLACVLLPEWLNVLEASLYLRTATSYARVQAAPACLASSSNPGWERCPGLLQLHREELVAALVELLASFVWFWSWLATYARAPGRGLTLWDLDCHSSILLVVGSTIYTVYNMQIMRQPESYGSNTLFKSADILYFVGAVLYLLASLRDCGVFEGLPLLPGQPSQEAGCEGVELTGAWLQARDAATGALYRYNRETRESEWVEPQAAGPAGWLEARDAPSGAIYFHHSATGEVSWTRPAGDDAARETLGT